MDLTGLDRQVRWMPGAAPPQLRVARGGCFRVEDHWQGVAMRHPDFGFYLVDEPGMTAEHAGRQHPYVPGAITLIPPWWTYTYRFTPGMAHAFLHVAVADWPGGVLRRHLDRPVVLTDAGLVARYRAWCSLVVAEAAPEEQAWSALFTGSACIDALLHAVPNLAAALLRRGGAWRHLGPALELVERELARPLAVDELAAALGCSREHCARLFRRHLGQSPVRYIQEQRVARAVQFIRQGEPLESVARRVGVGTRQYLGRLISRHLGQTAAAWR